MDNPLRPLVSAWLSKIRLAQEFKKKKFQDDADEAMFFFHGPYDDMYGIRRGTMGRGFVVSADTDDLPKPTFRMTVNKVAEMVQLFGPALYHKNPIRQVNPRSQPGIPPELFGDPNDPNVQMQYQQMAMQEQQTHTADSVRAMLLQTYLNWTPTALDLKTESRWAIDEAIIKGGGCLWTELYYPAGSNGTKMVGSFFDTVDNLLYDPDAESDREAQWVAKRCIHPVWQVEEEYGLPQGTLKGNLESYGQQASTSANKDGDYDRKRGLTNDLLVYWKIYSKMGMGARLSGLPNGSSDADVNPLRATLDQLGKFCYLVVADGVEYPLNLPEQVVETVDDQAIHQRIQWPTPFWADDSWPFTLIAFHKVPREIWPMSHLKPGIGELKFINWVYSMLAGKVRIACRDFLAVAKSAGDDLKDQIRTGDDYTMLEVEAIHGNIDQMVKFLQHPEFHPGIVEVLKLVEENFEKRVGLTELMYGLSARQLRSATEANDKQNNATIRPDDMANKVEDAMGEVARKEALACRWHLDQNDVAPVLGPMGAQMWAQLVMPSDPSEVIHQLEYRIEAGSAKKPNKDRDASNMSQAMQSLFQPLFQVAMQTGTVGPVNALISDWAKSLDLDASKYILPPPPPPQPPPPTAPPQQKPPGAPPIHIHNHPAGAPHGP